MRGSSLATRAVILWTVIACLASGACSDAPADPERIGGVASAIDNGTVDSTAAFPAVGFVHAADLPTGQLCSGTFIAKRMFLTAAHCVGTWISGCADFNALQLKVTFADTSGAKSGGFANLDEVQNRSVVVRKILVPAETVTVKKAQCPALLCPDIDPSQGTPNATIDAANDIALLVLERDPPPDVALHPFGVLVDASAPALGAAPGTYAGTFGSAANLVDGANSWFSSHPIVTIVGYGTGSTSYEVAPGETVRGRDFGAAKWSDSSNMVYRGRNPDCSVKPDTSAPAVVVQRFPDMTGSSPNKGDSGGPVLFGRPNPPPLSQGIAPTALPSSIFLQPDTYFVAGVARAGTIGFAGFYTPTYTTTATKFLMDNLLDDDGDGYANPADRCPGQDDGGPDGDLDGVADVCDPCRCDPENDGDGDGFCNIPCADQVADNCPSQPFFFPPKLTKNPKQAIASRVSQGAHTPGDLRGDQCHQPIAVDTRAPPVAFPQAPIFSLDKTTWLNCIKYVRAGFDFHALASHGQDGSQTLSNLFVPTAARFCQRSAEISCVSNAADIQRDALTDFGAATSVDDEKVTTHFHRITIRIASANGTLIPPADPFAYLNYVRKAEEPAFAPTHFWDYEADYATWIQKGLITDATQPAEFGGDPNSPPGPHHLAGNLWINTMIPWGGGGPTDCNSGPCDLGKGVRTTAAGPQLNNFHSTGPGEDYFKPALFNCPTCGFLKFPAQAFPDNPPAGPGGGSGPGAQAPSLPPANFSHLIARPAPVPPAGDFTVSPQTLSAAAILVPLASGEVGALSGCGDGGAELVTSRLGPTLAASILSGKRFASIVEPSRAMGAGLDFPLAVALSPTGDQITAIARSSGATLSASGDAPACSAPASPSAPAFVRAFGSYGSALGQLNFPVGVGADSQGNTFVVDRTNHRVCKFNPVGAPLLCWGQVGTGDGDFGAFMVSDGPYGLEVDKSAGRVCVADTVNSRVQCFDRDGNFLFKFGSAGTGPGQFAAEIGLGIDPATHEIYVADTFNQRIQVFDASGAFVRQWGTFGTAPGQLGYPRDVAVDSRGNVYVAEYTNGRISMFDRLGNFVRTIGSPGSAPGQLDHPHSVAVDSAGLIYVAAINNDRVQVFSPGAELVAWWGTTGGANGQFSGPIGIDVDARGQIYVSDHFNHRVQVFGPLGQGCPGCPSGQCVAGKPGVCCERPCAIASDCASGYCSAAGVCDLAPRTGSPHAKGYVAVLTSYRRGVFVVGGDDPQTSKPTGEIWFTPLAGSHWGLLSTKGYTPERVLAATYSFASDRLYVLDETAAGSARLTAIDPTALTVEPMGSWPRHASWDQHDLVVDADGAVLVASSSSKTKKHAIARFAVAATPPKLDGIAKGNRQLLIEPVVDGSGYTLVLRKTDGDEKDDGEDDDDNKNIASAKIKNESGIVVSRRTAFKFKPATLADLGKQL